MTTSFEIDLDGPVHFVSHGGEGTPILLIHGLGGSHVNWAAVGDRLAGHGSVTAIDLIGFGRTAPLGRTADVSSQCDLVIAYLRTLDEPAVLVGNSMGGLVSILVAEKAPELVAAMVLVDPALPTIKLRPDFEVLKSLVGPMLPVIGKRIYAERINDPVKYMAQLRRVLFVDQNAMRPQDHQLAIEMAKERATMPWVAQAFKEAAKSLFATIANRRAFSRRVEGIDVPALVVQGDKDRLVQVESARWLIEQQARWDLHVFPNVGHVPMLEVPDAFMDVVGKWLAERNEPATVH